jgi:hypothetical protein
MKPRLFTFVFLLCSSCLFSAPKVIDFGTIKSYPNRLINIDESRKIGRHAFNGAYEIGTYIADLKDNYQINIAVETGTFKGDTTLFSPSYLMKFILLKSLKKHLMKPKVALKGCRIRTVTTEDRQMFCESSYLSFQKNLSSFI